MSGVPREDVKELARLGYDKMAERYLAWSVAQPSQKRQEFVQKLFDSLSLSVGVENADILELGCGAGVPVTQMLSERCRSVTANDISLKQISLIREHIGVEMASQTRLIESDMTSLEFAEQSFDGVVALFSLIHLEPHDQVLMSTRIHQWLRRRKDEKNGYLIANFGATQNSGQIMEDWLGARMYWSSSGSEGSLAMLREAGFDILHHEIEEAKGDSSFVWVLAQAV